MFERGAVPQEYTCIKTCILGGWRTCSSPVAISRVLKRDKKCSWWEVRLNGDIVLMDHGTALLVQVKGQKGENREQESYREEERKKGKKRSRTRNRLEVFL